MQTIETYNGAFVHKLSAFHNSGEDGCSSVYHLTPCRALQGNKNFTSTVANWIVIEQMHLWTVILLYSKHTGDHSGCQSPVSCYNSRWEERARDKIWGQQESRMISCSWGTKGHEAARNLVFIDYICVKDNGWRAGSVSRDSNGDYGGLVIKNKAFLQGQRGRSRGAIRKGRCLIILCRSYLALWALQHH